jgi:hypothetical protein
MKNTLKLLLCGLLTMAMSASFSDANAGKSIPDNTVVVNQQSGNTVNLTTGYELVCYEDLTFHPNSFAYCANYIATGANTVAFTIYATYANDLSVTSYNSEAEVHRDSWYSFIQKQRFYSLKINRENRSFPPNLKG